MNNFQNDIDIAVNTMNRGDIILYPTDTIWGIGCDATNASAIKKIFSLKKREESKSLIILLTDINDIDKYALKPSQKIIEHLKNQFSPTTAIFQNAINLPIELINEDGSIAIRVVKDSFCEAVINTLGKPIVSTSANISGESFAPNFSMISTEIKNGVDYIVQHRQNEVKDFQPSSIIKINDKGEIEKLR